MDKFTFGKRTECITFGIVKPNCNKERIVCFRVDEVTKRKLSEASSDTGSSVSNLIRLCIHAELKRIKERYGRRTSK